MASRRRQTGATDQGWLWSLRFSGYSALVFGLVVLAVASLAPNVTQLVAQRQQIAELSRSVTEDRDEVERLKAERERWNDKTFVTSQARDRLYFVKPGEVSFIVINDIDQGALTGTAGDISDEVEAASVQWPSALLGSIVNSGGARTVSEVPGAVPDPDTTEPAPADGATPTPAGE
ncbi:FtsB family cell division protein [Mycetocola reblochoni]|uniref:Cell division protein DivIC (FtsB), stabilizes FtsL against RasP cleavage n=2 Tax=Mycetocola reblochoni TaxID=331618 RepID=A0A1R4I7S9_9MICO|nr:septum formation initiator family protein [Mycetocola reblochoni]RLP68204.1 septum formation initiator family protein [Mycetocola reblochoni]SJN15353.1 Cell division protein DivIC (FtsB), stabilizes FtsL against RasP cleavage [Mycetocola reblochoni REB411]